MEYAKTSRGIVLQHEGREEYYIEGSAEMRYRAPCCASWRWKMRSEAVPVTVVQFKNKRTDYYLNTQMLRLEVGDLVTVSTAPGHDVGAVTLTGWAAHREYLKRHPDEERLPLEIFRLSTRNDIDRWIECVGKERDALIATREEAQRLGLEMKIFDVEYQGDGNKLTVYYSSEQRVDFRMLVKQLAERFGVRIQMQQQGVRQEPARIGGLGPCGQELCCSRFMKCTPPVLSAAMKMQDLQVIACTGQCGKLKCCLNFELNAYVEARGSMPKVREPLRFDGFKLYYVKSDIFRKLMWFSTAPNSTINLVMLTVEEVLTVMDQNARGEVAAPVEKLREQEESPSQSYARIENVIEADNISRFDQQPLKKRKKRKGKSHNATDTGQNAQGATPPKSTNPAEQAKRRGQPPRNGQQAKPGSPSGARSTEGGIKEESNGPRSSKPTSAANGSHAAPHSPARGQGGGDRTGASMASRATRPNARSESSGIASRRARKPQNDAPAQQEIPPRPSTERPPNKTP